ncbi:MAG: hypothetical protein LBS45_04740 [Synergistaceae bacterium]|jgi:hypothetical protein|nr:hypothetical protein [Synergistaceae bacterium]
MKRTLENNGNNDPMGENHGETAFERRLEKAFLITGPMSNKAISACFFLFLGFLAFLALWKTTGINWTRYAGAGCFLTGIVTAAIAFAAQTASQYIRSAELFRALEKGEKPREFKEGTPEFVKIVAKCFRFVKSPRDEKEQDRRQICASNRQVRSVQSRLRVRNHARSYRRAARPAFAHASSSPGGGGSDDSGDPPGQQNPVTPPGSSKQPNSLHHPWRSLGRFRVPSRSQRRRSA